MTVEQATTISRVPGPALRPFVSVLWASIDAPVDPEVDRECMLPTGTTHVVLRLDRPVRLYEGIDDTEPCTTGLALVGGVRSRFYVRDVSESGASVGAMLHPGACEQVLGVPAEALADRHTDLEALWGSAAERLRERIAEAPTLTERLDRFEAGLVARLPRVRGLHPAVAEALHRFPRGASVGEVVDATGISHRRFIDLFRRSVGLTPKVYSRVHRFTLVLDRLCNQSRLGSIELALAGGYSDQAHLIREFREFTGVSPGRYRELAPTSAHHLPLRR